MTRGAQSGARSVNEVRRSAAAEIFAVAALGAVIGFSAAHQLLGLPGVVGLIHDWGVFPYPEQTVAYFQQLLTGWFDSGLGYPAVYPTEYPYRALLAFTSAFGANGDLQSKALVATLPGLAFVAAVVLGRAFELPRLASWAVGLTYALNPVVLNKLVSGQASYLVGYIGVPLVFAIYLATRRRGPYWISAVAVSGAVGLATIQIQLGLVAMVLLGGLIAVDKEISLRRRGLIFAVVIGLAIILESSTIVGIISGGAIVSRQAQFRPNPEWVEANSVPLFEGLRLSGYLTRYDQSAVSQWSTIWSFASWVVFGFVIFGLYVAPRRFKLLALPTLVAIFLLTSGVHIGLGGVVQWLFEHFRILLIFRELYHLIGVAALFYSLAIGYAVARMLETPVPIRAPLILVLFISVLTYGAPVLGGNGGGWLRVFPYDRDLQAAFYAGRERTLWLPMVQPLAFREQGHGVDPMYSTPYGSLWSYSLEWPLTAIQEYVRDGRSEELRDGLSALGVGRIVERHAFESRLGGFVFDPSVGNEVFAATPPMSRTLGKFVRYNDDTDGLLLTSSRPRLHSVSFIALGPRRMSVAARVEREGGAALAFETPLPVGVPYDVYEDIGDQPYESLATSQMITPLASRSADARLAFAPIAAWWWYRPAFADVPDGLLALGRQTAEVTAGAPYTRGFAVVAWVCTRAGGRLQIASKSYHSRAIDTRGPEGAFRSTVVELGPIESRQTVRFVSLDPGSITLVRSISIVDRPSLDAAMENFKRVLMSARHVYLIDRSAQPVYKFERSGSGNYLANLDSEREYRLEISLPKANVADATVSSDSGEPLGLAHLQRGLKTSTIVFQGMSGAARIDGVNVNSWKLSSTPIQLSETYRTLRTGKISKANLNLVELITSFSPGWGIGASSLHLPTALGLNLYAKGDSTPSVATYRYSPAFLAAYLAGTFCLCLSALCLLYAVAQSLRPKRLGGSAGG